MSIAGGILGEVMGDGFEEGATEYSLAYNLSGKGAADAAEEASQTAAAQQQAALDYLKEVEAVPQAFRTAGTETLGGLYGLGTPEQQEAARQAFEGSTVSQFYEGLGGARLRAQEGAIARHAAATGGLRSGSTQRALAQVNAQEAERLKMAKMGQYLQGLGQLSQLQTNPQGIYTGMTNVGNTLASGQMGAAQAQQQGASNVAGLGMAALAAFSDARLKTNIEYSHDVNGHGWHTWTWNKEAEKLGLSGDSEGVIAQDVIKTNPDAVIIDPTGFYKVDYSQILRAS